MPVSSSAMADERSKASALYRSENNDIHEHAGLPDLLRHALYASKLISYAQGFSLLKKASEHYQWNLDYGMLAKIWRKGCIIRSVFLEQITRAYHALPGLENLLFDDFFRNRILEALPAWRKITADCLLSGIPIPCMAAALTYFDGLRTCPSCGERTLRDEETCRCCGAVLPPEGQEPPSSRDSGEETFDYSQMYRQFGTSADPEKEFFEDAFGKEAKMDGIDRQDWLDYIGPAAPAYLAAYSRMQLQKSKVSMSFSALLFGPFYFFYRKAWKPAFGFLAAELLLAAPTFIEMLQLSAAPSPRP